MARYPPTHGSDLIVRSRQSISLSNRSTDTTVSNNAPSTNDVNLKDPMKCEDDVLSSSESEDNDSVYESDSDSDAEFRAFQEFRKDASSSTCFLCSMSNPNVTTLRCGRPAHVQCLGEVTCCPSRVSGSSSVDSNNVTHEARFRYKARINQTCLICFQEAPDIATLCCGKVIHVECMSRWLNQNDSCPNCRGEMTRYMHLDLNLYGMLSGSGRSLHPSLAAADLQGSSLAAPPRELLQRLNSSSAVGPLATMGRMGINSINLPTRIPFYSLNSQDVDDSSNYDSNDEDLRVSTPTRAPSMLYSDYSHSVSLGTISSGAEQWCFLPFENHLRRALGNILSFIQPQSALSMQMEPA